MLLSALVLPMNHTKKVTAKTIAQSRRSFPNLLTGRETLNSLDFSPLFFRVENTHAALHGRKKWWPGGVHDYRLHRTRMGFDPGSFPSLEMSLKVIDLLCGLHRQTCSLGVTSGIWTVSRRDIAV